MLTSFSSRTFKRDIKRLEKRGKEMRKLRTVLELLVAERPIPPIYRDHSLKGDWAGYRDLHIEPDWLLLYRIRERELQLMRTGTHADLFGE